MVSDNYRLYPDWINLRQSCLAHYIRKAEDLSEREDESMSRFGENILKGKCSGGWVSKAFRSNPIQVVVL